MAERVLKNNGAGYNVVVTMYPNKLTLKTSSTSLHIVTFQTDYKDTQLQFHFDESYPSRVPKVVVSSTTLTRDQKSDLCELLQRKGKAEEYNNNLLLPILLDHVVKWLKENYGKKQSVSKTTKKREERGEIREDTWQMSPSSGSGSETSGDAKKQKEQKEQASISWSIPGNEHIWKGSGDNSWTGNTGDGPWTESDKDWIAPSDDWSVVQTKQKNSKEKQPEKKIQFTMDTVPRINVKQDLRRANYFVAIRFTNGEIGNVVEDVVKRMLDVDCVYKPICYNRNEVHVTLTTVALHTEDEVQAAVKALEDAKEVLIDHAPSSCLVVSGMDNFQGGRVVYGRVKVMEDVLLFRQVVRWAFKKAGICPRDNFDYQPHMTIAKINVPFERKTGLSKISRNTYESLMNTSFGKQGVKSIHLCKMGHERRGDGFYICPTMIDLTKS